MSIWSECAKTYPGFVAAGLFDREGMFVDGYGADASFNLNHAAASFVSVLQEAHVAGDLLGMGRAREVQLVYGNAVILLRPLATSEHGMVVGLAANAETPLGRIRMAMDLLQAKVPAAKPGTNGTQVAAVSVTS